MRSAEEKSLEKDLRRWFRKLERRIQKLINLYYEDELFFLHINKVTTIVEEMRPEYEDILLRHCLNQFYNSREVTTTLYTIQQKKVSSKASLYEPQLIREEDVGLFRTNPQIEDGLRYNTFQASDSTLKRVTDNITNNLADSYHEGLGIDDAGRKITKEFAGLKGWESRRIARTEINSSCNVSAFATYDELGVEHHMWWTGLDDRVRDSHRPLHGHIVKVGNTFSNGLLHPGDKAGEKKEWINCRCTSVPFIMPLGMMAPPGMQEFTEADLIPIPGFEQPTYDIDEMLEEMRKTLPAPQESLSPIKDMNGRTILNKEKLVKMDFQQIAEHHGAKYNGVKVYDRDGKKYHVFTQTYDNGKTLTLRFEDGAVKSYTKKGWVHPNEIVNEVFKVPDAYKRQTDEIWFKNTNQGILHRLTKSGFDSIGSREGGYNAFIPIYRKGRRNLRTGEIYEDPNHRIVINPKFFKGASGKWKKLWGPSRGLDWDWRHALHHEFAHSIDLSREAFAFQTNELSNSIEYINIHRKEPHFTGYANTRISESFAEHGGYISQMLANPHRQKEKITVKIYENHKKVEKEINFEEYKQLYPEHYEYFTKLIKGEIKCY